MRKIMGVAVFTAVMLAACASGPGAIEGEPSSAPGSDRALVITIAPTNAKAATFDWMVSGQSGWADGKNLSSVLATYARNNMDNLGGFDNETNSSRNRVGLRVDARAPMHMAVQLLQLCAEARIYRISMALLQDWNGPWHRASSGPRLWRLDQRFIACDLPVDDNSPWREALAVNVGFRESLAQLGFYVGKGPRSFSGEFSLQPLFDEMQKHEEEWRRSHSGLWSQWRGDVSNLMNAQLREAGLKVRDISIGNPGEHFSDPAPRPAPAVLAFLALEAWSRTRERDSTEVHWVQGAASGFVGPQPENKHPPGEFPPDEPEIPPDDPKVHEPMDPDE